MHRHQQLRRSESEISRLLSKALGNSPACLGAKLGPIIQSDIPGRWTVHLQGDPSGTCQRAFLVARSELQEQILIAPYERR